MGAVCVENKTCNPTFSFCTFSPCSSTKHSKYQTLQVPNFSLFLYFLFWYGSLLAITNVWFDRSNLPMKHIGSVYNLSFNWLTVSESDPVYVVFSNRHELRRVDVATSNALSLISGLRNTIALDFYYKDGVPVLFWTDVMEDKIYRGTMTGNSKFFTADDETYIVLKVYSYSQYFDVFPKFFIQLSQ